MRPRQKIDRQGLSSDWRDGYKRMYQPVHELKGWRRDAMTLVAIGIFLAFAMGISGICDG